MDADLNIKITEAYQERDTVFREVLRAGEYRFKVYTITHKSNKQDAETYKIASELAEKCVNEHTVDTPGYGPGYIIIHKGMDGNFIIIGWWSNENMVCLRGYYSSREMPLEFRDETFTGRIICVWDEKIHHHERNAWVKHILSKPAEPDTDAYMNSIYSTDDIKS